jgi:curved DNA-binding protein CbpA
MQPGPGSTARGANGLVKLERRFIRGGGMNFYAILGVPRNANDEAIRSAFRILARRYHPDRGAGSSAEKFRQVNEAYETLIDPGRRHTYDLSLQWVAPRVPVRVEPTAQSGLYPMEDAAVFGTFSGKPQRAAFRTSVGFDELFDRWFDDLFFGPEWPW